MNCELTGFCYLQIGSVELEIRNSKENLHTKIFLIHFNRKSGTFAVCHVVSSKVLVSRERLHGFQCNLHRIDPYLLSSSHVVVLYL